MQRLGLDSELPKLSVIHVAGTKGKGSTCAMVERMLRQAGYRTGLFTSPHLIDVRERIRINGWVGGRPGGRVGGQVVRKGMLAERVAGRAFAGWAFGQMLSVGVVGIRACKHGGACLPAGRPASRPQGQPQQAQTGWLTPCTFRHVCCRRRRRLQGAR